MITVLQSIQRSTFSLFCTPITVTHSALSSFPLFGFWAYYVCMFRQQCWQPHIIYRTKTEHFDDDDCIHAQRDRSNIIYNSRHTNWRKKKENRIKYAMHDITIITNYLVDDVRAYVCVCVVCCVRLLYAEVYF